MEKFYKIKVTADNGQFYWWHKGGKVHLLPEELVDTWVAKFKPEFFDIMPSGEMVGAGRSTENSFKIKKVEKVLES
ncbi:MAG: hypothetical protein IPJ69_03905 [Deltaproteobacteria bacterium]|nr:MAG: hypothetical protein IPJ69_03905 [Deltaproteobacteria bacterium]